jgi:lipid II:glycine glycyltransferase (peptidoglycan interpeptide bridge formation enzyme)
VTLCRSTAATRTSTPIDQEGEPGDAPARSVTVTLAHGRERDVLRCWDAFVQRTPGTDVTQLSAWARVRSMVGFKAIYIFAYHGDKLVGGAQLLCRAVPVVGCVGYVPYGPLVDRTTRDWEAVRSAITDALRDVGRERLRMLFVQPPEFADDVSCDLLARGFRPSSACIAPPGSVRIDLTDDLAQIRNRFGRRLRSWPHRWEARGVTVSVGSARDLPMLARLMEHSARRHSFMPPSYAYLETLYRELAAGGNAALFVGRVHGLPVAADLVTICGGMIRGRLCGFDRGGEAARLSVPAAIRWEIIKWGKAEGLRWLDFGGLSRATLDGLLDGGSAIVTSCDQPKLTFGGTPFRYPLAVELVTSTPLRIAYDLARVSPPGRHALVWAQIALRGRSGRRYRADAPTVTSARDIL